MICQGGRIDEVHAAYELIIEGEVLPSLPEASKEERAMIGISMIQGIDVVTG